jgi:hypothetical protein
MLIVDAQTTAEYYCMRYSFEDKDTVRHASGCEI